MPSTTTLIRDVIRRESSLGHFPRDHVLFENFAEVVSSASGAAVNKHFIFAGTGTPVVTQLSGGGFLLSTRTAGTADNDTARIVPAGSGTAWNSSTVPTVKPVLDFVIRTPAAIGDIQIYGGFKLTGTNVMATDADQVLFLFDTDDTVNFGPAGVGTITASANWLAIASIGGDDEYIDTGVPVAVNTNYRFTISIDDDYKARYAIDGTPVLNGTAVHRSTALTTTGALLPQIGVATRDSAPAVRTLGIRNIRLQRPYA